MTKKKDKKETKHKPAMTLRECMEAEEPIEEMWDEICKTVVMGLGGAQELMSVMQNTTTKTIKVVPV